MRGDIYLINLDPVVGSEANKTRPAVIVSNDHANAVASRNGHGVVTVVPLTSNTAHVYSFQVLIDDRDTGLTMRSKAQAEQIRAVDVSRLVRRIGGVGADNMAALDRAIKLHLDLA
jgi:mRNA interferase MazF